MKRETQSSAKQIAANRRNSQRSTGPRTAAGKQVVSQNAVQHGLTAMNTVLFSDEQEDFDRFAARMREDLQPEGALERFLVDRMIDCGWRLRLVPRIERGIFVANFTGPQSGTETPQAPSTVDSRGALLGKVYARNARTFERLSRHERHIELSYQAAARELQKLNYARAMDCHPYYISHIGNLPPLNMESAKPKQEGHRYPAASKERLLPLPAVDEDSFFRESKAEISLLQNKAKSEYK